MLARRLLLLLTCATAAHAQAPRQSIIGWNASFDVPSGWRVLQVSSRAVALTDSLEASALFVTVGYMGTALEAEAELKALFADLHYRPTATQAIKDTAFNGQAALVASYQGRARGGLVDARAAVVFSRFATGIVIIGLSDAARFPIVSTAVAEIAGSVEALLPSTNVAWVVQLSGHWDYVAPAAAARDSTATGRVAIDEWVEFDGRERFTWHSRTVVAVPGAHPMTAENRDDTGTYTVVGKTLILRGKTTRALDIDLLANQLDLSGRAYRRRAP